MTVSSKVSWYVGNTEFWWYHEDYGRMPDKCSTSSAVYFKLSDGRIGFCTQCFKDSVEGNYSPGGWYRWIDSTAQRGIARILAYGAPNNGDTSDEGIKATALAIWDMAAGYYTVNGSCLAAASVAVMLRVLPDLLNVRPEMEDVKLKSARTPLVSVALPLYSPEVRS